jgi:hypothetical protein
LAFPKPATNPVVQQTQSTNNNNIFFQPRAEPEREEVIETEEEPLEESQEAQLASQYTAPKADSSLISDSEASKSSDLNRKVPPVEP